MPYEKILISKIEFDSTDFDEKKKKREAEGWEYVLPHGSFGEGFSKTTGELPDASYVGYRIRKI
jgi:hypothetical protein